MLREWRTSVLGLRRRIAFSGDVIEASTRLDSVRPTLIAALAAASLPLIRLLFADDVYFETPLRELA